MNEIEAQNWINKHNDLECWKVGLAYGSTVYLEFGNQIEQVPGDASRIVGEMSLWLYSDDWRIERSPISLSDSSSVNRQVLEDTLVPNLVGSKLVGLSGGGDSVEFALTDDLKIKLWRPSHSNLGPEDDLFHCFLPSGKVLRFNTTLQFFLDPRRDSSAVS